MGELRLGIADHFGWAVAVTAADHEVIDRRRIELLEPGMPSAPIHHEGKGLDDDGVAAMVEAVRVSIARAATAAFDDLEASLPGPVASISLRTLPAQFPTTIAAQRRVPYEARADAVMYREVLCEVATMRRWKLHFYNAKTVEQEAAELLAGRAERVLHGPRERLGPPWAKDHRVALAATIVAAS